MLNLLRGWGQRYFSDPQAVIFMLLLTGSILLVMFMGQILAPLIASIVLAYLLQWFAQALVAWKVPRLAAVLIVYSAFLGIFLAAIFILWPIIWQQLVRLFEESPSMVHSMQQYLYLLPERFPELVTRETLNGWVASFMVQMRDSAKDIITFSLVSLPNLIPLVIYLILVPLMVFFFLKDNDKIIRWVLSFLPEERNFMTALWKDVHKQIGNYIRGKGAEVFIVGFTTFIVFYLFDLRYSVLLSVLVGLSVLIPYIGAIVVTIPVVLVAFFQWGWGAHFGYLVLAYGAIQALDGSVLVPILFSEVVNLHPLAIIIAVLVFGGWWGLWGVFFAIPLASLVKAILDTWPGRVRLV